MGLSIINVNTKSPEDIKGTFHARIVTIKDANGKDLIEVEKLNERYKEYTEELYKKILMTWIILVV